jgi:hypothetical protein
MKKIFKWFGLAVACLGLLVGLIALVGFFLPQDHVASGRATFNRPAQDVWAAITNVDSFPAWRSNVSTVEVISRDPLRWREVGSDDTLTFEVVEARPPSRLVSEIADRNLPFGGRWVYELKPAGSGTELVITEHGQVYNPIFRFVSRFVIGHTATIETYLADLQRRLN